jgi:chromate transporter
MEILSLAWTFFKIGVISFGGGWTIVGIIQHEVVARGWMTRETFADVVAIAQVTPGPVALNAATMIGFRVGGLAGALAASIAVVAFPMLAIALVLTLILRTRIDEKKLSDAFRVATIPLIAMTLVSLGMAPSLGWHVWLIAAASCALSLFTRLDPILLILGSGAAGAILAAVRILP